MVCTQSNLVSEGMYTALLGPPLPVKCIVTSNLWNLEDCRRKQISEHKGLLLQTLLNINSILQVQYPFHYYLLPILSNTGISFGPLVQNHDQIF